MIGETIRSVVRDGLAPGQHGVVRVSTWSTETWHSLLAHVVPANTSQTPSDLAARDRALRRLEVESAELRRQLDEERQRASNGLPVTETAPLYQADLVRVRILGTEASALWRTRPILGGGAANGIRETALVLDDPRPLLDAGQDAGLATDQPVFAGGTVLGKITRVGQFSSTLCPVTDPAFLGSARLVRRSGAHIEYGASGTLQGDGTPLCRLVRIPAAEPVAVGDLVVTVDTDGLLPPQVYGTVVKAEPPNETLEWQIQVEPAAKPGTATVQVLRTHINAERVTLR